MGILRYVYLNLLQECIGAKGQLPATAVYKDLLVNFPGNGVVPTVLEQCQAEQRYVRESMTRTLLYAQVNSKAVGNLDDYLLP